MARYDRSYDRGYGARRPRNRGRGEEVVEYEVYDDLGRAGRRPGAPRGGGGYDRGAHGSDYPAFGGYPGSGREGIHYGGGERPGRGRPRGPRGYDAGFGGFGFGFGRGYDRGLGGRAARYGGDFARAPFMPEAAYLRHPEYDRPPTYHQNRWEQPGRYEIEIVGDDEPMSDEEIRDGVRRRLYQDSWLDADAIEVSVDDGVVTLRGEVHDFLEARYAWDDAWESEGVRGVVNHLTVRADEPATEEHGDVFPQDAG